MTSIGYVSYYTYLFPRQSNAATILDMIEVNKNVILIMRSLLYDMSKMYKEDCPFLSIRALNEMDRIKIKFGQYYFLYRLPHKQRLI